MDVKEDSFIPDFCRKKILILGCGNILFGDDGFGPAVIQHLIDHYHIPDDVYIMDVGTGVRKLLFTLSLNSINTKQIIIIDAVDKGRVPGEIFELTLDDLPHEKADDFSLHQVPSSNLAKELRDAGINVRVLVCQVKTIPEIVKPGLSNILNEAVPKMCTLIAEEFFIKVSNV